MKTIPPVAILASILGLVGLIVIAFVVKYAAPVPPAAEPIVNNNAVSTVVQPGVTTGTSIAIDTTSADEIAEPQPTVSHTVYAGGQMLHLSSYQDSSEGTMPAVYSFDKSDYSKSSLNFVGDQNDSLFGATDSTLFYANGIWGQTGYVIYSFDLASESSTELFSIPTGHSFYGAVSSDGSQIVYLDRCGILCEDESLALNSTMRLYDVASGTDRELFNITDEAQGFVVPKYWLDEQYLVMEKWYEGTEGPQYIQEYYILNVDTGDFEMHSLAENAQSYSVSSDRARAVYTTFTWDQSANTTISTIEIKNIADGSVTTVITSDATSYSAVRWQDDDRLIVVQQEIDSIFEGLGTKINGSFNLLQLTTSGAVTGSLELPLPDSNVSVFDVIDNNFVYLVTNIGGGIAAKQELRILDLSTFIEKTLLSMENHIEPLGNIHKY